MVTYINVQNQKCFNPLFLTITCRFIIYICQILIFMDFVNGTTNFNVDDIRIFFQNVCSVDMVDHIYELQSMNLLIAYLLTQLCVLIFLLHQECIRTVVFSVNNIHVVIYRRHSFCCQFVNEFYLYQSIAGETEMNFLELTCLL